MGGGNSKEPGIEGISIYNGYYRNIMVLVKSTRIKIDESGKRGVCGGLKVETYSNTQCSTVEPGFATIVPGEKHFFPESSKDGTLFVTIKIGIRIPYENVKVPIGKNQIVTTSGSLVFADKQIPWRDTCGNDHYRNNDLDQKFVHVLNWLSGGKNMKHPEWNELDEPKREGIYIYNGYYRDIMARVTSTSIKIDESGQRGIYGGLQLEKYFKTRGSTVEPGFATIVPGEDHFFSESSHDGKLFVTIKIGFRIPYENVKVCNGQNQLVTKRGSLACAQKDIRSKDLEGRTHKRRSKSPSDIACAWIENLSDIFCWYLRRVCGITLIIAIFIWYIFTYLASSKIKDEVGCHQN